MRRHAAMTALAAGVALTGAAAGTANAAPMNGVDDVANNVCAPVKDVVLKVDGADIKGNYPKPLTSDGKALGQYDLSAVINGVCGQVDYPEPLHPDHKHDNGGQLLGGLPVGG